MNRIAFTNLRIVAPLSLWGFALSALNFRWWKNQIPAELQLGITLGYIGLNILYLLYYLLLISYLKRIEGYSRTNSIMIKVCMVSGTLFTFYSFI